MTIFGPTSVGPGVIAQFGGVGGTGPYTYSVLSGPGSINASTGAFTAGSLGYEPGDNITVIQAVDSLSAKARATIYTRDPIGLLCDIIQNQMALDDGQVYLYNQKIDIPIDSRLYIAIGVQNVKVFGNVNRPVSSDAGINSIQWVNCMATLKINVLSRTVEALYRKEEVLMAIWSTYAEQQQELNAFQISRLSSQFVNLSEGDGAAIPYRFNISVNLQYAKTKNQAVPYYDTFSTPEVVSEP